MQRFLAAFSALALMTAVSGCCCHHLHGGGGCPPPCPPPCGPCGVNYGGYPAFSQAYVQPAYTTASISPTGFATATACDCGPGVNPF